MLLALGCLAPVLSGCTEIITQGDPRPNIALQQQMKTLKLSIGSTVPDSFMIPGSNFAVQGWHGTLRKGFRNGFMGAYALVQGDGGVDQLLTLDLAELGTAACVETNLVACVLVRYQATLTDSAGATRRTAGSAESRYRSRDGSSQPVDIARANVDSAIETMYERIAKELFPAPTGPLPR